MDENRYTVTLPKLGESIVSAKILQWFKKENESIALDEPLLEVTTDKVNSEIPSPVAGVVEKILVQKDTEVQVGAPLAIILTNQKAFPAEKQKSEPQKSVESTKDRSSFLSPAVMRLINAYNIPIQEINDIPRTGEGGRLTKKDIEEYHNRKSSTPSSGVEKVPMSPMRKAIADAMVRSFYQAPHASLINEIDVTKIMNYIAKEKEGFLASHKVKLSITSYIAHAIAKTVKKYPYLNASLDKDAIALKKHVNLGIAVSVEHGILVPVIKNCEKLSLVEIAKGVSDLAIRARSESLQADEVTAGSITMTNFGMAHAQIGIPIIRFPEVAIVGLGAIERKVVALDDEKTAIRKMMHVCLTFDHRVIDGIYGCQFLYELKQYLESSDILQF